MKRIFLLLCISISLCQFSHGQYSISGYLDTPDKNKRVYLSQLNYNEEHTMRTEQVITSTLTDSSGYFSFEGELLSDKYGFYRIHSRVEENETLLQMASDEEKSNLLNFIFSNKDTIVFEKNSKRWFSTYKTSNPIDSSWQEYASKLEALNMEIFSISDLELHSGLSLQVLSDLKRSTENKKTHPLIKLLIISNFQEHVLREDIQTDPSFYTKLEDSLNAYYGEDSYALQYVAFKKKLSLVKIEQELIFYRRTTYILSALCVLLSIGIVFLFLTRSREGDPPLREEKINLTKQEERIAELILQDKTNKDIATELFISLSTVKTHIRNLYSKLEASNRQDFINKMKN